MLREFQPQGFDVFAGSEIFLLQTIAAMKAVIAWQSGDAQWAALRPPLVPLDAAQCAQLHADLEVDGFTIPNAATLAGTD